MLTTIFTGTARDDPSLLEPILDGGPDIRAQELYARAFEWARTDEDVRRRVADDALGDAADQEALEAAHAVGPHDDHVRVPLLDAMEDLLAGDAEPDALLDDLTDTELVLRTLAGL